MRRSLLASLVSLLATSCLLFAPRSWAVEAAPPEPPAAPAVPAAAEARPNQKIAGAEPNKWLAIHEQAAGDEVRFKRQEHGGGCFDSKRNRIVLFGSNTHGKDWTNSPLIFDVAAMKWSRLYPNDEQATYKADARGLAVAGANGDHPWATHTFGTVIYDSGRDEMVVCCYPGHMVPGRFSNALAGVWGTVKVHPTWTFSFAENKWVPLACKPVHFFPNAAAWDSDRKVVVGYGGSGLWELGGEPREWKKIPGSPLCGWHNNAVYDSKNKAVLVFGSNENSNDMIVLRPEAKEHKKMPTPGTRPPKDQHCPMAFDPVAGRTVVVIDSGTKENAKAETWLYDLAADSWQQIPEATLPFGCGMNYNMYYDPTDKACLLVTEAPAKFGRTVTVFALKIDLTKLAGK